ncbi:MAG: excinuclease ABC subunit UvrA [Hyphomicrobiales bacterium]|nr:excinuclease ABC subunit UvrA [Hyphomicrobiales bacterium]
MEKTISVRGAREHNLQNVNIDLPRDQFIVITGLSGSGKSSLAFDTIYAEGQRRYVESLSAYARQFLEMQDKPDVDSITGLSPAIAIEQKTVSKNPRSTVATVTEIYDYLRLLYARAGIPYSPATGLPIESQTVSQMVDRIMELPEGTKLYLLAPIVRGAKGEHRKELRELQKQGFTRIKLDGELHELETMPEIDKNKKHEIAVLVDRLVIAEDLGNRLPDSIETALRLSNGLLQAEIVSFPEGKSFEDKKPGDVLLFSEKFCCPVSGFQLSEIEPRLFSFNSPYGACPVCDGLGTEIYFDAGLVVPDRSRSLSEGAIAPWRGTQSRFFTQTLEGLAAHYKFDIDAPFGSLSEDIQKVILHGSGDTSIKMMFEDGYRRYTVNKPFEGVLPNLQRRWKETDSSWIREEMEKYQAMTDCHACGGYRLREEALCVKIAGKHVGEICEMTIAEALAWFESLPKAMTNKQNKIAERILQELLRRSGFLNNVGLDYLTLSRRAGTLSGGEGQRIRLASQIGSGLTGVLYVLDEPSIGLHQCDNQRLLTTLQSLRDIGNTVIVVEHDEETMRSADYIVDIGPGAGRHGGKIIADGTPEEVLKVKDSITAQYLRGDKCIAVPANRRKGIKGKVLKVKGACTNNLQNVTAEIPVNTFTCVTGVSGGGKSSLVLHTLYPAAAKMLNGAKATPGPCDGIEGLQHFDKVIEIDQSPIGRTPRSNPATYTGAFSPIRDWFAGLPEAKARGYKPGRFSFNVKGGRCEACQGDGMTKIEMHFLPDVYVKCDVCHGQRYNRETLEVTYKGKSIADVLDMTVQEAYEFFEKVPVIKEKLKAMIDVGIGYIHVGQSATTLSGGEAQRIKLAKELSKRSTGRTLYILDEPTTGLHTDDISKLLKVLHMLVEAGNTMVVIEHNLDVIKTADWILDIGPGGGKHGGHIVASGTPEQVAKTKESVTGQFLLPLLGKKKAA